MTDASNELAPREHRQRVLKGATIISGLSILTFRALPDDAGASLTAGKSHAAGKAA